MSERFELFRGFPWKWTLYWLLTPNLAIIMMWPIGGPPMQALIVLFGGIALFISQLPWRFARTIGAALLTLWIFTFYVAAMFAIPSLNFAMLAQFIMDVRPLRAPEYILGGIVFLVSFIVTLSRAPSVRTFDRPLQIALAGLTIFAFSGVDALITAKTSDGYRTDAAALPFSSAVKQVALSPASIDRRNVLIIVVEALGLPVAPEERRLFKETWLRPEWQARFAVSHGSTPFYGATTSGELRELCGAWSDYAKFDFDHAACLPARFRASGYETSAMHGFSGSLFGRDRWYPKLAFEHIDFGDDLLRQGVPSCDGVFPGACDTDLPPIIQRKLTKAARPQFIYWMTLNSHLPIPVDEKTAHGECIVGSAAWKADYPRVCRLLQKHRQLADALGRLMMAPDLPPTDILIVGDHKPPFFDRGSRAHFDQNRVPWIYLRYRGNPAGITPNPSAR